MNNTDWKGIAELIGIVAIVASLVFVGVQMRQDRQIAQAQVLSEYGESHTVWTDLVVSNADVWVRGLDGGELSATEAAQFDAMATGYWVQQRSKYLRSALLVGAPDFIILDTANFIYQHEGLQSWFQRWLDHAERRSRRPPYLNDIAETLDGLANGEIAQTPNHSYMPSN